MFVDGRFTDAIYPNEILNRHVVPFSRHHGGILQHDNARPHVARVCTDFLQLQNINVLPLIYYHACGTALCVLTETLYQANESQEMKFSCVISFYFLKSKTTAIFELEYMCSVFTFVQCIFIKLGDCCKDYSQNLNNFENHIF